MWVLKSFGGVVVAGPFKSEAAMAKKLGLSQQYVNRQISNGNFRFRFDGRDVLARRAWAFLAGTKGFTEKADIGAFLGVPQEVIDKVFRKNTSGFVQTPNGKVKIQKLKPGEKPTLPAVRVLWDDDTEKQDFVSFADAARELKIDSKTIPNALKAGRDSFCRKSDGKKFTIEIPKENTPSRKKPKPLSEEQKQKRAKATRKQELEWKHESAVWGFYSEHVACEKPPSFKSQVESLELFWPEQLAKILGEDLEEILGKKVTSALKEEVSPQPPAEKEPQPPQSKEDPPEEEETHSEDPSEEEEDSSEEEDETHSEKPPQPPIPRPIPAPRKKVPIPAPAPIPRPIPAPRMKVSLVPVIPPEGPATSVPLPRRKVPWASPKASPEDAAEDAEPPPIPPEVAEVIRAGKTFSFETSKKLEPKTFLSTATLARFIKSGCGKLFCQGPKTRQMVICNNKMVHLPDLVRGIIVFHIRDQMWKNGDKASAEAFMEKVFEFNLLKKPKDWIQPGFLRRVRELDDETIEKICKEFMKMV